MYITCCALKHNVDSVALHSFQEVVIYNGLGRGPMGITKGMLYLMKDAFIIPVGQPSPLSITKMEQLNIQ